MSSFRPDLPIADQTFRPGRGDAGQIGRFVVEGPTAGNARRATEAPPACTPEQHAQIERVAYEKGLASAEADQARCEQACAAFEAAAVAMGRASVRLLHESREAMLALAAEIAQVWIGAELRIDPARFAGPLERALAQCDGAVAARIHLHPEVLSTLAASLPEWIERWSERLPVEIAADDSLAPAAFRIETETQSVGAGLETLGPRLRDALASAFEIEPEEAPAC